MVLGGEDEVPRAAVVVPGFIPSAALAPKCLRYERGERPSSAAFGEPDTALTALSKGIPSAGCEQLLPAIFIAQDQRRFFCDCPDRRKR